MTLPQVRQDQMWYRGPSRYGTALAEPGLDFVQRP
jgi:hypothetical protein